MNNQTHPLNPNKPTLYFPPINKLGNIAFRKVCNNSGADFVFTEMVRVEKIIEGDPFQLRKLKIPKNMENKTIVQIICEDTTRIEECVDKIVELTNNLFEINYNMGCPQSTMAKNEHGGGIVKNPKKVFEVSSTLANACKKHNIKASIKIRIGKDRESINILENVKNIKQAGINKIYIHGRTLLDGYRRPATYEEIGQVKTKFPELEIIGNGDVIDLESLNNLINTSGCDGVLVGRAALNNPYIFKEFTEKTHTKQDSGIELKQTIPAIIELLNAGIQEELNLDYLKQNIIWMTKGVIGSAEFRTVLNNTSNIEEFLSYCKDLLKPNSNK
jgi:tRNA-dihydrouridine synthase